MVISPGYPRMVSPTWLMPRLGIVAGLYFLSGLGAAALAQSAGYATLFWPPAGFALAAVMIWSYRMTPAVFLGAFLLNLQLGSPWPTAMGIALGASVQAWVGAVLLARVHDGGWDLFDSNETAILLIWGGLVACLVNALVGPLVLLFSGVVSAEAFVTTVLTWWVGDVFGVAIFAPVFLLGLRTSLLEQRVRFLLFFCTVLIGTIINAQLFAKQFALEKKAISAEFTTKTQDLVHDMEQDLSGLLAQIESLRAFFDASEHVDEREFRLFTSEFLNRSAYVEWYAYQPLIRGSDLPSFISGSRMLRGDPRFFVWEHSNGERVPVQAREHHLPILFLEPQGGYELLNGYDALSDPHRRAAVYNSLASRKVSATSLAKHPFEPEIRGLLAVCGIFNGEKGIGHTNSLEQLKGIVSCFFRLDQYIPRHLEKLREKKGSVTWLVEDRDALSGVTNVLGRCHPDEEHPPPVTTREYVLSIADINLHVVVGFGSEFYAGRVPDGMIPLFYLGLLVVALMGLFIIVMTGSNEAVRKTVVERTKELLDAKEEAEKSSRLKEDFVSVVSHELRTPLTAILGSLGLLTSVGAEKLPQASLLEIAKKNADRLLALINDLLDVQKLESGQMEMRRASIHVPSFLEKAVSDIRPFAQQHAARVVLRSGIPKRNIYGDESRLHQVMTNLLSNAIKFSEGRGPVEVGAEEAGRLIRISVRDRGPGIPEEFRDRIFIKFSQADSSGSRRVQGTGLGLSICKAIIDAHGGEISYHTRPGEGTTFFFEMEGLD